ncbi:MAG: 50S ribosomal protein L33 [Elusimicrobiota bacterium]
MRELITLACPDCKNRNYQYTKDKKTHQEKTELKKYCKFCKKRTLHRETK